MASKKQMSNQKGLMFSTLISLDDPFVFSSKILFDLHTANFEMSLIKMSREQFDEEESGTSEDRKGSTNYEVVSRSSSIQDVSNNDDETFKRVIKKQTIYPHASGEEDQTKVAYLLSIQESQSFMLFDEIAKSSGSSELCLPLILNLDIKQKRKNLFSAATAVQEEAMQVNAPLIADYRYQLSATEGADLSTKSVPFTVHHLAVSVFFNQMPAGNLKKAVTLEFFADGRML